MKSIRARLTILFALSATVAVALLFVAGYSLLENRLIHGLDLLNASEFAQLESDLGTDYNALTPAAIDARIRETSERSSVLFYINLQSRATRGLFYSNNLHGQIIPDIPGTDQYNTAVPGIGELRVDEFVTKPFDVVIGTSLVPVRDALRVYVEVCAALLLGMLIASIAIGFGLSHVILRPIRLIRETAGRIGHDNLSERIPVSDVRDEISDLARLLNQMFDRLETAFDQVRRFAAEASHELKTPLSLIRLHAEKLVVDGRLLPEHQEAVLIQLEELERLSRFIDELLFLSRAEANAVTFELKPQNPTAFLDVFQQDASALVEYHNRQFVYSHEGSGVVAFEERWIRQVLLNLLSNALAVTPPQGWIRLQSTLGDGVWRVTMEDQGPGVPKDQRERIFERFVRLPTPNIEERGCGLGLAICRSIIGLHKGVIFADVGEDGVGLRVIFEIPAEAGSPEEAIPSRDGRSLSGMIPQATGLQF
jgi:signal transduction histidine kinase